MSGVDGAANSGGGGINAERGESGGDGDNNIVWFLYAGQPIEEIPRDITHLRIDPSVKVIPAEAFCDCRQLVLVELCEGLECIGMEAFRECKSLKCVKFPSTVKVIGVMAFYGCEQLEEVELREGLERIDPGAFNGCKALKRMKIPSTVKSIAIRALCRCQQLIGVELCDGVENIDIHLFESSSSLRNLAIPPAVHAPECFRGCHDLLEVFGSHQLIGDALKSRFDGLPIHKLCYYQSYYSTEVTIDRLKNIISEQNDEASLVADSDTLARSGERKRAANWSGGGSNTRARHSEDVSNASVSRSDSSSSPTDISNSIVDNNAQDCLGMTPLHILACSTKQDFELYQFIVASQPKSLITEDKWGCLPILYAIWGGTSYDVMLFLIRSQKAAFPNYVLDWDHMIETLCRAGASLNIVKRLLDTQEALYSNHIINWQKAAKELTIRCLVEREYSCGKDWREGFIEDWGVMMDSLRASPAYDELVQSLLDIQTRFFVDQNDMDLQIICEELVKPLTGWWRSDKYDKCYSLKLFRFLVKCGIANRLNAIGVRKWRMNIKSLVERTRILSDDHDLDNLIDDIHSKLIIYEREYHQLKDAAFSLELILWKSKVDELEVGTADLRRQCRINCGADIIIPNVLPYLIADEVKGKEEDNGGDEDYSMDDSEEGSDDDDIEDESSSEEEARMD